MFSLFRDTDRKIPTFLFVFVVKLSELGIVGVGKSTVSSTTEITIEVNFRHWHNIHILERKYKIRSNETGCQRKSKRRPFGSNVDNEKNFASVSAEVHVLAPAILRNSREVEKKFSNRFPRQEQRKTKVGSVAKFDLEACLP